MITVKYQKFEPKSNSRWWWIVETAEDALEEFDNYAHAVDSLAGRNLAHGYLYNLLEIDGVDVDDLEAEP